MRCILKVAQGISSYQHAYSCTCQHACICTYINTCNTTFVHVDACTCWYTCERACDHAHGHTDTRAHMHACVAPRMHAYPVQAHRFHADTISSIQVESACTHARASTQIHARRRNACVHVHVDTCACMRTCMCSFMHVDSSFASMCKYACAQARHAPCTRTSADRRAQLMHANQPHTCRSHVAPIIDRTALNRTDAQITCLTDSRRHQHDFKRPVCPTPFWAQGKTSEAPL